MERLEDVTWGVGVSSSGYVSIRFSFLLRRAESMKIATTRTEAINEKIKYPISKATARLLKLHGKIINQEKLFVSSTMGLHLVQFETRHFVAHPLIPRL